MVVAESSITYIHTHKQLALVWYQGCAVCVYEGTCDVIVSTSFGHGYYRWCM